MIERYAIRFVTGPHAGKYMKNYDPNFQPNPGKPQEQSGLVGVVTKKEDALTFETPLGAFLCWRQRSTTFPTRADGKPNCPATAYTIEIVKVLF